MNHSATCQKILTLIHQGQLREAAQRIEGQLKQFPTQADYWHLYSVTALQMRNAKKAIEFASKAANLAPNNLSFQTQLASALQHNMQFAEAISQAQAVEAKLSEATTNPAILDSLGTLYTNCGDVKNAQRLFEQAVKLDPESPHLLYNLATACRGNGLLGEAEAIYDKVIAKTPQDYEAYANRSQLRKQTADNNHVKELTALLNQELPHWRDETSLSFALAKEHEDMGNHSQSFSYLKRGADLRRKHMNYQVEGDLQAIEKIIQTFTKEVIDTAPLGCDSAEPIFILGLPRTGTTLVERIVDSHSAVFSAGELQNFASTLINQVVQTNPGEKLDKMALIEKSIAIDFEALGQSYINSTRPATGHTAHFVDKLPLNYLYIGLIKLAMPKAKIIHLTRHPLDACYAIYKTAFKDAYPFSYDLEDLGRYYLAYHKLMAHWHQLFPNDIMDISYETLVHNQERESRRLIEHCGLDWEEACLQFHKNPQASMTASAAQVRQPIYKGSVEKWRHYEKELQPLIDLFTAEGLDF